jgi:hypothetical protein
MKDTRETGQVGRETRKVNGRDTRETRKEEKNHETMKGRECLRGPWKKNILRKTWKGEKANGYKQREKGNMIN